MLPEEWQSILREPQLKIGWLGRGVKWVEPENLHLTLKFLGETPGELVPQVESEIGQICDSLTPFQIAIQGTGCFPNKQRPRAYWAGLTSSRSLETLHSGLEDCMSRLGFEPDDKKFVPHLTVARIKEPIGKERMTQAFLNFDLRSAPFSVERVSLVQSVLRQEGPLYNVLRSFPLKNNMQ